MAKSDSKMDNPMLKRRLNPFLVAATILVLSLLAGLSVMYQGQIAQEIEQRKSLQDNLEEKKQKLSTLKAKNANLSQELQTKQSERDKWITIAENRKNRIAVLNNTVDELEREKADLKSTVEDQKDTIDGLEIDLNEINETLGDICGQESTNITDGAAKCNEWGHEYEGG